MGYTEFHNQHWFSVVGLAFDLVGAVMIVEAGHISRKFARRIELKANKSAGRRKGTASELGAVLELMVLTSGKTMRGFMLVIVGAVFQVLGSWPF